MLDVTVEVGATIELEGVGATKKDAKIVSKLSYQ